ncbi:hypothetical protein BH10PSE5_BH10PSE5_25880 [soil metagenome]
MIELKAPAGAVERQDAAQPWYARRSAAEARVAEASLIASEVELKLELERAKITGVLLPKPILDAFDSADALDQIEGAIEFRRWKAGQEGQPQLALTYEVMRECLARASGAAVESGAHFGGNPPATDDDYHAAINSMLDELRRIYALVKSRDLVFGRVRFAGLFLLIALFALLASAHWLGVDQGVANLIAIAAAGGLGAILSIMRRMQDANTTGPLKTDPVQQISALRQGYPSLALAACTGPLFALTLFVVFASGLVTIKGLTPDIVACGVGLATTCREGYFTALNHAVQFSQPTDALKMMLWGFVAGFAETLVPDVLDKISGSLPSRAGKAN